MKIGAQFYTLRDYCKDLDGLSESLKKVADIGYTTVQISGTCPFEAEWLKKELDKNGLESSSVWYKPDFRLNPLRFVCVVEQLRRQKKKFKIYYPKKP